MQIGLIGGLNMSTAFVMLGEDSLTIVLLTTLFLNDVGMVLLVVNVLRRLIL